MSSQPSRTTMARERSWFVGFTRREVVQTSSNAATAPGGRVWGDEVEELADQVSTGAVLSGIDPETEREPPRRPLTIIMPRLRPAAAVGWSDAHPPPNFQQLFMSIQKPEVVLARHVKALNFNHQAASNAWTWFPKRADGSHYIRSASSTEANYADRIGELNISNDEAFRALSKTTKPGQQRPRLAHFRGFWIALDNMAQYWTSEKDPGAETYVQRPGEEQKYKGRRIDNGAKMPDSYRADAVSMFVAGIASAFKCRVTPPHVTAPHLTPILQIKHLDQPVRLTGVVSRLPSDNEKARARILEGPIMGVLERNDIDFTSGARKPLVVSDRKSIHDFLREAAALLLIAQERRREGKTPQMSGEGKWYTTRKRWGGGPGGKLGMLQQREDEMEKVKALLEDISEKSDDEVKELKKLEEQAKHNVKKAQKAARNWEKMACNPAVWDSKTDYKAIGKEPGSEYDEIFLVSCLFHHVCLLKLTIHDAYIDYLTTGVMPDPIPEDSNWCSPVFERTMWLDLFCTKERVYAFSIVWAALEYMNRETSTAQGGQESGGGDKGKVADTQSGADDTAETDTGAADLTSSGEAASTTAGGDSTGETVNTSADTSSTDGSRAAQIGAESSVEPMDTQT